MDTEYLENLLRDMAQQRAAQSLKMETAYLNIAKKRIVPMTFQVSLSDTSPWNISKLLAMWSGFLTEASLGCVNSAERQTLVWRAYPKYEHGVVHARLVYTEA